MDATEILAWLRHHADPRNAAGMARYGINTTGTLGVSVPLIRRMAKKIGRNHSLAPMGARLRFLGCVRPGLPEPLPRFTARLGYGGEMGVRREFVRRAGFSLMAGLAVMVKKAVNWALRAIGKKNGSLRVRAILAVEDIARIDSRSARWIASGALRELKRQGTKVL